MIKTFTALLKFQLELSQTALMKANKPETSLSVVGNLYRSGIQKSVYLHLFTDCFITISPQSLE